ncbi:MAG: rhamnosyltransferase [Mucilaginibacter sp.]|nr:rhamnosyltransferase [Mucilaginibacter sp.]
MKPGNKKTLAGCIVLYNPTNSVIKNIESYLPFLNTLYVIDNTECVDEELIKKIKLLDAEIVYIQQGDNKGIAWALNKGAALALELGYQWLLTMDQDSYFLGNEFFDSWHTNINYTIGLVAASYTNDYDRWQKEYSQLYNEIHFAVTSGNIINLKSWENVGGFEEKLFIDEVDHDYCLKLRKHGFKILISKKVLMGHMVGQLYNGRNNEFTENKIFILHSPLRYYYISRNVLYLCKKYFFTDFDFIARRFYYLIKALVKILLMYPDKVIYLGFFFKGIKDFALSRYNKYDH